MILVIIICTLITIVLLILFLPVQLKGNSEKKYVMLSLTPIGGVSAVYEDFKFQFSINFLGFGFAIKPRTKRKKSKPASSEKVTKPKQSMGFQKFKSLASLAISSVKLNFLRANIDTGDYPLNALLIPIANRISNNRNISVQINFEQHNTFDFKATAFAYKLIWIVTKSFIKTKKPKSWKTM